MLFRCIKDSVYIDDGYSGSNFDCPGFKQMIAALETGQVNMVITKDLSRLGRDMRESSYYAEEYFPERGIVYLGLEDNFNSSNNNTFAPLQFAVNEVMLRQTSQKIKMVLDNKRANGQYCSAPPYGYIKDHVTNRLLPNELSAPIVQRIFQMSADGESTRQICRVLNSEGVFPPLKFKATYRASFTAKGLKKVSDTWQNTTVVRILKNEVYLGHTLLGKTSRPSLKSKKKLSCDPSQWSIHRNTHEPLVSKEIFEKAQQNLGYNRRHLDNSPHVRKSIFNKLIRCGVCGSLMCSCDSVYKGEREKYWYLSCRYSNASRGCGKSRIRYRDLCELICRDLNFLIEVSCGDSDKLLRKVMEDMPEPGPSEAGNQCRNAERRLQEIDATIRKLYTDNIAERINDNTLNALVPDLEKEAENLRALLSTVQTQADKETPLDERYRMLFAIAKQYQPIETLTRDIVVAFIDKIEIFPKVLAKGYKSAMPTVPFTQKVVVHYKFVDDISAIKDASGKSVS